MIEYAQFQTNLAALRERIAAACCSCGRAITDVSLLPVTKNHPVQAVQYVALSGLPAVGENRVQEAADKQGLSAPKVRWELIGHLQSNKARLATTLFDRIQSVDSLKLLRRLNQHAGEAGKKLPILLQCNTGRDPNKFGFSEEALEEALEVALGAVHLHVDGVMTIAPYDDDPIVARSAFDRLRERRDHLASRFGISLPELSMGMSSDLESAIAAGSTQIRVGTALFGART